MKIENLIKNLNKDDFLISDSCNLNNKKLNSITVEYIKKNPINLLKIGSKYLISDGRHRVFMACLFGLKTIPCHVEVVNMPKKVGCGVLRDSPQPLKMGVKK